MTHDRFIRVGRTARLAILGEPGPAITQVWVACHGYGQLAARFLRRFQPLDDGTRLIVAPEALNRFYIESEPGPHGPESRVGATWMTREDRLNEIEDYIAYLEAVHDDVFATTDRAAVRLIALGFSQGVSTIVRWAARTRARVDRLVLWAGSWPPEIEPRADLFHDAALTLVAGTADPAVSEAAVRRMHDTLRAGGLEPELIRHEGGHIIDGDALRRMGTSI